MKAKIRIVIKDMPEGVKFDVYIKKWWIWQWEYGYRPISSCYWLFEDDITRLMRQYPNQVLLKNTSLIYAYGKGRNYHLHHP